MNRADLTDQLTVLVQELIPTIADDYRTQDQDRDDQTPAMDLTIGADASGWGFQTGDNSYSGGAYGFATWAVTTLYRDSNPRETAEELIGQLVEDEGFNFTGELE